MVGLCNVHTDARCAEQALGRDSMEPVETVLHFIECINARDPDRLVRMMTEDHVFIDSLDARVSGCENMRAGWRGQTPAACGVSSRPRVAVTQNDARAVTPQ
jgi:ketosteroid isomerase-like protein